MLKAPNRKNANIQREKLLSTLNQLPEHAIPFMRDVVLNGMPFSEAVTAYNISEEKAAQELTSAMLAIYDFIHDVSAIGDIGHDDTNVGLWSTKYLPIDGRVEAYMAIAEYLLKNSDCWKKSIAAFDYAVELVKIPGSYPNAAKALQLTGTTFLEVAQTANLTLQHQNVLFDSAKYYLEQARATAELICDEKIMTTVLLDIGQVHLQQKNFAMAMVYAEIAKRHADASQDELQQEQICDFSNQVRSMARKGPTDN